MRGVQVSWYALWLPYLRCGGLSCGGCGLGLGLIDKHKKRPVFYAGLVCVLWFLLDPKYTADNCHSVQDPPFQGFYAALTLRLLIMHNCSALQA